MLFADMYTVHTYKGFLQSDHNQIATLETLGNTWHLVLGNLELGHDKIDFRLTLNLGYTRINANCSCNCMGNCNCHGSRNVNANAYDNGNGKCNRNCNRYRNRDRHRDRHRHRDRGRYQKLA